MKRYFYYYPVAIIVISNILYDVAAMSFPKAMNVQAGLTAYYLFAASVSLMLFYLTSEDKNFKMELKKVNWATFTLALGCTGIDLGYVLLFRAGWNISYGSLICNIMIAVTLVLIGVAFFHEYINKYHLIGISLCLIGFGMINI